MDNMFRAKTKYLWKPVQTADAMARQLIAQASALPQEHLELKKLASKAATRLDRQQEQMLGLMNYIFDSMPPEKALDIFIKAGIDRNELVDVWGVEPGDAVLAQGW